MRELKLKILIVRLCQRIATGKQDLAFSRSRTVWTHFDTLDTIRLEVEESLGIVSLTCLSYVLGRTEEEIIQGIADNHPLAIEFDSHQIKELKNV